MKPTTKILGLTMIALLLAVFIFASSQPTAASGVERVFVEFVPGQKAAVKNNIQLAGGIIHYEFDALNAVAATVPTAALNGLSRNPNVVLIEEDAPRYPATQTVPYGINSVQAPQVWAGDGSGNGPTGSGITVCVIDSGLMTAHEDFAGVNVIGGYPANWNSDSCGHGTHVAGTIAAANNSLGVVGVAPDVSLFILKVFDGDSCGWSYSSTLIDAANRCASAGAKVINMSLSGGRAVKTEENGFNNLYNQGVLSVAAAGNDGSTRKAYPASYASVISVAAIDSNNVVADFSQKNNSVELAAPGVDVLSTVPWNSVNELTVDSVTYSGNHIEFAALGTANALLANGGLCTATNSGWSGKVVLCERGDVSFFDKVRNVQNSGGVAAVIYNNEPGGFLGTLGAGNSSTIPAISLSQEDGQFLVANKLGQTGDVVSTSTKPASGYEAWNGTSMATPHVAGVAALIWSSNSSLSNADIRNALTGTALDLGPAGRDNAYGFGLVQANAAWQAIGGDPGDPEPGGGPVISNVSSQKVHRNGRFTITWNTDVAANSEVVLTCCGTYTSATLTTSHSMTFNGSNGVAYEYHVRSTGANGNSTTEGPFTHQN